MSIAMRPLWSKEPCVLCGDEGYATRTQSKPKSEDYICEGCELYSNGYNEGHAQATMDAQPALDLLKKMSKYNFKGIEGLPDFGPQIRKVLNDQQQ